MNGNDKIVEIKNSNNDRCADPCKAIPAMPTDSEYAYAYLRFQNFAGVYDADDSLINGTVFPQLNMPYDGRY